MRLPVSLALIAALLLPSPALADALVDNVDGMTLNEEGEVVRFTGIVMSPDGKVVKLLKRGEKRPERPDWRADLKGRVVIPGMVDAHGHVMSLGFRALALDLSATRSLAEAQDAIRRYAAENSTNAIVTAARSASSMPSGRNKFTNTVKKNSIVMSGTPRKDSM